MGYVGVPPQSGFITTAKQRVTSSTNNYVDLDHSISSLADVIVWVNFVKQDSTNLSLTTSSRITLGANLVASDIVEIAYLGKAVATQTPSSGTVTNDMLSGSITASKLSSTAVDNTNTNSTLVTGQTAITSLADTDKFLVSDASDSGNLKYVEKQYLPSGTLIEIAEANVTSNVGSYFFSNVFSSTYDSYLLQIRAMKFASDQTPQMRFTTDTGTTENSSSYHYWSYYGLNVTGSEVRGNGNGDSKILFTSGTDADSSSDGGISGEIRFFNPFANDSRSAVTTSQFTYRDDNNTYVSVTGGGVLSNSSPRYGFVLFGNSNIALLKATLYGIVK